jgi:ankyrin repeat protein
MAALVAVALAGAPAHAQASDSHKLIKAVRDGDAEQVQSLLSLPTPGLLAAKDRDTGETALHIVVAQRNLTWLRFLLSKQARLDLQDKDGNTPLATAARLGWTEGAAQMLADKANVDAANRRGETPLILAVQKRDLPMVRLLMKHGANPKRTDSAAGLSAIDYAKRDARATQILKALEAPVPTSAVLVPGR